MTDGKSKGQGDSIYRKPILEAVLGEQPLHLSAPRPGKIFYPIIEMEAGGHTWLPQQN